MPSKVAEFTTGSAALRLLWNAYLDMESATRTLKWPSSAHVRNWRSREVSRLPALREQFLPPTDTASEKLTAEASWSKGNWALVAVHSPRVLRQLKQSSQAERVMLT